MSEMTNQAWVDRQTASPEARRMYEQERLILWTTEAVAEAMAERDMTRAQLAEVLGTSRANVTQLLSGSRNMTLRTLAAVAHACDFRAEIQLEPLADWRFEQLEGELVQSLRSVPVWQATRDESQQGELLPPREFDYDQQADHAPCGDERLAA